MLLKNAGFKGSIMKKIYLLTSFLVISFSIFAKNMDSSVENSPSSKPVYLVKEFILEYMTHPHHDLPCLCEFMSIPIPLKYVAKPTGFDVAATKEDLRYVTIEQLEDTEIAFYYTKDALDKIMQAIEEEFHKKNVQNVKIQIDPNQIDDSGKDLRKAEDHRLILQIFVER